MIKHFCLTGLILLSFLLASAQDEGNIVKRDRIERDNGVFIGLGPSFTLGKNIGDYSTGFSIETGYTKRINRILSLGSSLSYLKFNYDPDAADDLSSAFIEDVSEDLSNPNYYEGYVIELEGGDVSLLSLALNLKLNFVPVKDNSILSVYFFAKPFVSLASRTDVTGNSTFLGTTDPDGLEDWYIIESDILWGPDDYEALASNTEVTGGIFIGPGIEFFPAKKFSFFAQASFGYTAPITFVSTDSYDSTYDSYFNEEFPMVKEGFPSVNIQLGVTLNF
ncbi:MAG TPA: hypothetical protein PLS08_14605 [Chryseolinea sp.]|nr:hypothetical protein [Chryseolinea sp.]